MSDRPEFSKFERVKPDLVIDGFSMKCIVVAIEAWSSEIGDAMKALSVFKVVVYEINGGRLVRFIAKRESDELGLKGGYCKNGRDVQYEVGEDLAVKSVSYFK
jgi:hypothetical protein